MQGHNMVRLLVGLALLVAAAMKSYALATGPVAVTGLLTSRWALIAAVDFELAPVLCCWRICGLEQHGSSVCSRLPSLVGYRYTS